MKLSELLKGISCEVIQGEIEREISDISWDSRKVSPLSLFICVKNKNIDRHDFSQEAVSKGAVALIVEHYAGGIPDEITIIKVVDSRKAMAEVACRFYGDPSKKCNLIGITGTNGKTTSVYFIEKILKNSGRKVGIIGTIENSINGVKSCIDKTNPTTPDAIELQASFKEMIEKGADDIVMEVTSAALDRDRVLGCDFNIGIFTNLTQDHLDDHGTMENYKSQIETFSHVQKWNSK